MQKHLEKNKQVIKEMLEIYKQKNFTSILSNNNYADVISMWRLKGGGCSKCGGDVTSLNLEYYGGREERVECYDCQNLQRSTWK